MDYWQTVGSMWDWAALYLIWWCAVQELHWGDCPVSVLFTLYHGPILGHGTYKHFAVVGPVIDGQGGRGQSTRELFCGVVWSGLLLNVKITEVESDFWKKRTAVLSVQGQGVDMKEAEQVELEDQHRGCCRKWKSRIYCLWKSWDPSACAAKWWFLISQLWHVQGALLWSDGGAASEQSD